MDNKIDLSFAELHNPLFLNSVNWGLKLHLKQSKGELKLCYDREHGELLVKHGEYIAIVPTANVSSMTPMKSAPPAVEPVAPTHMRGKVKAQVGGPTDHVFAAAPGKTRD